jgi:heavy metal sensor kinase
MSLRLHDRIKRSFSLRLTFWSLAVSILAYIIVFALAYHSLSSSLKQEDRKAMLSKFKEYAREYEKGELTDLEASINSERDSETPTLFFVRVVSDDNSTLFLSLPGQWKGFDLARIGNIRIDKKDQRLRVAAKGHNTVFEIVSFPLQDGNFLQIGKEIAHREEVLARFRQVFMSAMIPAILVGLIVGYLVTYRALRPVRNLTRAVQSIIDTGDMDARVPAGKTGDELSGLVMLFNAMLGRIENLIKGMKESLDNVAHDLRTPMARVRAIAEDGLQPDGNLGTCREALSDCLEESERIAKMLNTMMDISEAKTGTLNLEMERVDVSALVGQVVELYRYIAEEKSVTITMNCMGNLHITVDPGRMRQALGNLLDNAVKYTPAGGRVDVLAFREADQAVVTVKDTGIGIREEDLPKIWGRLYRTDESRSQRGLGLGLSLVKSFVELHGGRVEASSDPGAGTAFTVRLPRSA